MKFLITCDNCDYQFLTTGDSRQTVQCQCPHCGGTMKVKLPEPPASAKATTPASQTNAPTATSSPYGSQATAPQLANRQASTEKPRRRTGCGIMVGIALGFFILLLIGTIIYSLTRTESTRPIEDPFQHAYDDSIRYDDSYDKMLVEEPDTQDLAPMKHHEYSDTLELSEPSENSENSESAEPTESSEHIDSPEPTTPSEAPSHTEPTPTPTE